MKLKQRQFRAVVSSMSHAQRVRFMVALDHANRLKGNDPDALLWVCIHDDHVVPWVLSDLLWFAYFAVSRGVRDGQYSAIEGQT